MRLVRPLLRRHHGLNHCTKALKPLATLRRTLVTLAIETSCDDTAVAIVEKVGNRARLHFNDRITADQGRLKGIHPLVAQESHEARLAALVNNAVKSLPDSPTSIGSTRQTATCDRDALVEKMKPDFVSVTRGPGMRSSLGVGLNVAKGLAVAWQIPLVGVHHMQAHALTPRLVHALDVNGAQVVPSNAESSIALEPAFPYLTLLVSGGHTMVVRTTDLTSHTIVVNTADYALGDCLDKVGRAILPEDIVAASPSPSYGALLESFAFPDRSTTYVDKLSKQGMQGFVVEDESQRYGWHVPVPYSSPRGGQLPVTPHFSFTGIESQATRIARFGFNKEQGKFNTEPRLEPISAAEARLLAREVMRVAFGHLANHLTRSLDNERQAGLPRSRALVLSGGVASNQYLRHVVQSHCVTRGYDLDIIAPPPSLCTDNAAMIGWTGCEMFERGLVDDLSIRSLGKWSLENIMKPAAEEDGRSWLDNNSNAKVGKL